MPIMALRPAAGLPAINDLAALFDVLRQLAFTREIDDAQAAPRDGFGLPDDRLHIEIEESAVHVRASTRDLRGSRRDAFADAERLLDAIITSGTWRPDRDGATAVHPARRYAPPYGPTNEVDGWFGSVEVILRPEIARS